YEKRLKDERTNEQQQPSCRHLEPRHLVCLRGRGNTKPKPDIRLPALIRQENNHQRFEIERQSTTEYLTDQSAFNTPATAELIAKFRLKHEGMIYELPKCTICLDYLKIGEPCARWPCPRAHLFHYDCILKSLRTRNTCPNCRHAVEGVPLTPLQVAMQRSLNG
ncbi:unnamed protein product, partial [Adineta steineri]